MLVTRRPQENPCCAETQSMTRLDALLLALLSAIGWGCAFALIGLMAFKGNADTGGAAAVFGAFGAAAGVVLLVLKLALLRQLPRNLRGARRADGAAPTASNQARGQAAPALGA